MDTPEPTPTPVRRTRLIPEDQNTLSALLTRVTTAAAASPYVLMWITPAEATQLAADFAAAVESREEMGDAREVKSARIRVLQRELNQGATRVKAMINEEWENDAEAESHYAAFGFVAEGDHEVLPAAQQARVNAIEKQLLPALAQYGMAARKYGTAWWTPRLAEYKTLTGQSQQTAQEIADAVGAKAPLHEQARVYLSKFAALLDAQTRTPDEYRALRRKMGYLKEYS